MLPATGERDDYRYHVVQLNANSRQDSKKQVRCSGIHAQTEADISISETNISFRARQIDTAALLCGGSSVIGKFHGCVRVPSFCFRSFSTLCTATRSPDTLRDHFSKHSFFFCFKADATFGQVCLGLCAAVFVASAAGGDSTEEDSVMFAAPQIVRMPLHLYSTRLT
eukprot:3206061-Rhodomonas_salina.5